jgi:hypothetical protein
VGDATLALRRQGVRVTHFEVLEDQADARSWVLVARLPKGVGPAEVLAMLQGDPHVRHVDWSR